MGLALVTGGTRGIGLSIARRLAIDGFDLALGYAGDDESADRAAAEIRSLGVACTSLRVDLGSDTGPDELVARAGEFGDLAVVVNNAGATYRFAALADTPAAEVRRTIDVNLTATVLVARAAVGRMSTSHGGSGGVIVNISSGAATIGSPGEYVHYAAAKAGVDMLTKGLGVEVAAQGIRVVGVAPGLIETTLHATTGDPGRVDRMTPTIPIGRAGSPDEIAEAVAWLVSPAASYVTATTLRVAGGR